MKIQYLAVIFIVIILPISITLSYYIQSQIDTISLQTTYNTKLYSSTYDAVSAFQINTVNNRYSSISNSKIRDIEAAVNTFYTSLAENETLTKEDIQNYVPALVFTLYDGYYIYNKYDNAYSVKDQGIPNLDSDVTTYGLKPYIYYSCRYKDKPGEGTRDFVVNYTLDNAITIYGNLGDGYETLSGYLIKPDSVKNESGSSASPESWSLEYDGVKITPEILTEHLAYLNDDGSLNADGKANEGDFEYLVFEGKKVYYDKSANKFFWYDNYMKTYINDAETNSYAKSRVWDGHLHSTSALEYFHSAKIFSNKVIEKIYDIKQEHAVNTDGTTQIQFSVDTGNKPIFDTTLPDNDPLTSGSTFNENRMAVIRNSITTNLATAIANYNDYSGNTYEYALPELSEGEWYKITNQVSVISFLQGFSIGHKYYNNYCVITNNENEEVISKENIYIVTETTSGEREYHLPGCTHLLKNSTPSNLPVQEDAYSNLSFIRQTLRISEGEYQYFYTQMRGTGSNKKYITACYYCIVNAGDVYSCDEILNGKLLKKDGNLEDVEEYTTNNNEQLKNVRDAYIKALARERQDLYQANMDDFNSEPEEIGDNDEQPTPEPDTQYVTKIELNPSNLEINVGESKTITATITPNNATNKEVTWSSSNTEIATVDQNGKVTGIASGEVTITATAKDGSNVSGNCTVEVNSTIEEPSWTMKRYNGDSLKATIEDIKITPTNQFVVMRLDSNVDNNILSYNGVVSRGDRVTIKYTVGRNEQDLNYIGSINRMEIPKIYELEMQTVTVEVDEPKLEITFKDSEHINGYVYDKSLNIHEILLNGEKIL